MLSVSRDGIDLLDFEEDSGVPPITQKPVLLLSDSMGRCIPATDSVFQVVTKMGYTWWQIARDITEGRINLRHKHVIIWAGADSVSDIRTEKKLTDVHLLVDAILAKNPSIHICFSALVPQPKNQHLLQEKINSVNEQLHKATTEAKVTFLAAHSVYLDKNMDIVCPIAQNYEDGFHLNLHGAHRIRKYWVSSLSLSQ